MRNVKTIYPMALLLIIAILAPLTAMGGPRDATVANPLDDQPWGGEIDNGDFRTGSISSVGIEPYPNRFDIIGIRNIGTPLVLFDFLQMFIFDSRVITESSSTVSQVNVTAIPQSTSYTPSPIRNKRFSIRKGR
jgi:hypothetical protein